MNIEQNGIKACIGADGVLDITTAHPLRVRLNGRMLNGVTGCEPVVPTQKYWQPDGTQGDSTVDMRGGPL